LPTPREAGCGGSRRARPCCSWARSCPPGSLHDRIVKDWSFVRSYVVKDGRLFLALMADGGIYELESRR
jgi:hypothetical protein